MNKESQREKLERQKAYLENLISYNQRFFNPNDITALELINYLQQIQLAFLHLKNEEAKKIDSCIDGHTHIISYGKLFGTPVISNTLKLEIWKLNFPLNFSLDEQQSLDGFKSIYGPKAYHQLASSINKINRFLNQNRIKFSPRVISPDTLPVVIIPGDNNTLLIESLYDITLRFENYFKLVSSQREERLLRENFGLANQLLSTISIEDSMLPEKLINGINKTRILKK